MILEALTVLVAASLLSVALAAVRARYAPDADRSFITGSPVTMADADLADYAERMMAEGR